MRERPARPLAPLPWWIAAWSSVGFHAVVLGFAAFGAGHRDAGGEGGIAGAGGDTIEVTVIASRASSRSDAEPEPEPETETETEAEPEAEPEPETETETERPVLVARDRAPDRDRIRMRAPAPEAAAPEPTEPEREPEAERATVASAGGSDATRSGRAAGDPEAAAAILGSVGIGPGSGRRAYLEHTCDDPIEGVWVAHRYSPGERQWVRFTLRIDREGDALTGTIMSRMWSGYATDRRPPPCRPDGYDHTHRMVASGTIQGDEFSFGASTQQLVRTDCPGGFFAAYAPDRFRGTVDTLREELDVLNNDRRYEFDVPYTFRRTSCLDEE